jgi:hypothetical protein
LKTVIIFASEQLFMLSKTGINVNKSNKILFKHRLEIPLGLRLSLMAETQ